MPLHKIRKVVSSIDISWPHEFFGLTKTFSYFCLMGTIELKTNLHSLIDGIENPQLLESLNEMLSNRLSRKSGMWSKLSDEERKEILEAYQESEDTENLIPHSEILKNLK